MDVRAIEMEWTRRRGLYRTKMRGYDRMALWVALPTFVLTFIVPRKAKPIAGCVFLASICVVAGASMIFSAKYLRCPNCEAEPAGRGASNNATTCAQFHARLAEELTLIASD